MSDAKRATARQEEVKKQRRRRQGSGAERNMKLHVPESAKDPEHVYRWANDRPGRVRQLTQQDDYEVVSQSELDGRDTVIENGSAGEGTVMARTADKVTGERVVLLKKPRKYYEADKAEEQKVLNERDALLRKGPPPTQEGLSGKDNAYVPGGRNIIGGR